MNALCWILGHKWRHGSTTMNRDLTDVWRTFVCVRCHIRTTDHEVKP